jgi:K+-transporting ATPase ATPase C chain
MWSHFGPALRMTVVFTVLTGGVYPAAVTAATWLLFPRQAHGSLVVRDGHTVGSTLIAQGFTRPEYLHPRPSAASYDASLSTGSNWGPTNQKLIDRIKASATQYRQENPDYAGPIPADALTASGSGLDPEISPANAAIQAARIAKARHVDAAAVGALMDEMMAGRWLGFIGEPRVNVLEVNLRLDERLGRVAH